MLRVGTLVLSGMDRLTLARLDTAPLAATAKAALDGGTESDLPSIRAWRATFAAMGFKPTQYRSAAEALLRRLRTDGSLPAVHPVVDYCNAVSAAMAIPLAAFDLDRVDGALTVCEAIGDERFLAFSGEEESPERGEVIFRDEGNRAHARRWTHRQSRWSAVSPETARVLLVAEALHEGASGDIERMMALLADGFSAAGARVMEMEAT
ncbi:hypothetical protein CXZ10_15020 [Pleomorphomonas diazotrophica]|uniref:B3/B4 tRNA-binding domain-containing protein n=2 Tax=Pleomorphomonas diazotrophica TaxID=1166257 RepID=A0A2N3LV03_9HYPH|nr:hypothetical protein CXZ10_15020 [Pleomorphomonas diazotrophica]